MLSLFLTHPSLVNTTIMLSSDISNFPTNNNNNAKLVGHYHKL
jgi:hypothetical protein